MCLYSLWVLIGMFRAPIYFYFWASLLSVGSVSEVRPFEFVVADRLTGFSGVACCGFRSP